jgi:endonuclease/exonuclease/phosphatase family metal-dependent hydrolase
MQDAAAQQVRDSQYAQIKQELLAPFAKQGIPQLVIGDLNTPKHLDLDYQRMLKTLGMKDTPLADERPYTWDKTNSWNTNYLEEPNSQLDYILLDAQRSLTKLSRLFIYRPFIIHKDKKVDLADHYGIFGEIELN